MGISITVVIVISEPNQQTRSSSSSTTFSAVYLFPITRESTTAHAQGSRVTRTTEITAARAITRAFANQYEIRARVMWERTNSES